MPSAPRKWLLPVPLRSSSLPVPLLTWIVAPRKGDNCVRPRSCRRGRLSLPLLPMIMSAPPDGNREVPWGLCDRRRFPECSTDAQLLPSAWKGRPCSAVAVAGHGGSGDQPREQRCDVPVATVPDQVPHDRTRPRLPPARIDICPQRSDRVVLTTPSTFHNDYCWSSDHVILSGSERRPRTTVGPCAGAGKGLSA